MKIDQVTAMYQIQPGDLLLIKSAAGVEAMKAQLIKNTDTGVEVILNKRRNVYFSVDMYLAGSSWAKDVRIVRQA